MNNADYPAMPSKVSINQETKEFLPYQFENDAFVEFGLTKREHFAGMAMQGLIARGMTGAEWVSDNALRYTDALLAELEKTK